MFRGKKSEQMRHQRDIQDGDDAHVQRAAQLSGLAREFLEKIFELSKNGARMLLKNQARRREENAFAAPLK